ncbi:MAG: NAD-dependent epimerase/dehydratase family protein [Ignavibacteria bacterium]|jgi:uncharacterized protein YbjT (DUF2867 family)
MSNKQRALVIGGTGLVGSHLLEQLDADKHFEKIYTLSRRPCTAHSRIVNIITELDVPSGNEDFFDVDVVFCAIGSTIKKAGSQAEFRRIDYELPMHIARLAKQRGAKKFVLVSSIGATATSRYFYLQVKYALERDLAALGFERLSILQPSLIMGDRKEFRLGELISRVVMKYLNPLTPARYRGVHARSIAASMIKEAREDSPGVRRVSNADILTT